MDFRKDFVIFISGAALALAFPPFMGGIIAFAGFVPLLLFLRNGGMRNAARTGFLWGLGFNAASLYWICYSTVPGGIAAIVLLALFSMIVPVVYNYGYRKWGERFVWAFPFLWVSWEYLRSIGDAGFPWLIMGNTQTYYTNIIQFISYTGVYGASMLVCMLNVLLYRALQFGSISQKIRRVCLAAALIVVPYVHGIMVRDAYKETGETIRISLVQGNIDPWAKWDKAFKEYNFKIYEDLSGEAARGKPDFIIWPESAATSYLRFDARYFAWVKRICDSLAVPLFTGALDVEFGDERKIYNAAFLFEPHSDKLCSYSKIQLVPMSERYLFREYLPEALRFDFGQGPSDFSRGEEIALFNLPGRNKAEKPKKFAAVICYESVFSSLVKKFCSLPADFLVIITNDAWFGRSSGTYQHAQYAVMRAIEHHIPVVRCANTGISMFINSVGEITSRTPIEEQAVLTQDIHFRSGTTFFTRHGDWFPLLVTAIGLMIFTITTGVAIKNSFVKTKSVQGN